MSISHMQRLGVLGSHLEPPRNLADLEYLMSQKEVLLTGRGWYDLNDGLSPLDL
jgi:hypothetical protein